jgi:hypothetical protein
MTAESPNDRPDCEEIILNQNLWALNQYEFKTEKTLTTKK